MGFLTKDRVRDTTTTTGTGTLTLSGTPPSSDWKSFAVFANGDETAYAIIGRGTGEWEVRRGIVGSSGTALTRGTLIASSTGSAVSFSAGTKDVLCTLPATMFSDLFNAWMSNILRNVSSGYTASGQVFVSTSAPTAGGAGDIWLDTSTTGGVFGAAAWVSFNGTGTVTINASGNVSSITDNGTGDYTVNFTNAMPDALYNIAGFARGDSTTSSNKVFSLSAASNGTKSASAVRVWSLYKDGGGGGPLDSPEIGVTIFR